MKKIGYIIVALLIIGSLATACAPKPAVEAGPIKIGALMDYTGPGAEVGQTELWGLQFKLDEIGWEIAGRKIELIDEDSGGDPTMALDKVKKLVEYDKVDVVIGPMESHTAHGVGTYLKPLKVPNIAFWEHTSDLLDLGNVFMPVGPLKDCAYELGIYAYDKLGYRTATEMRMDVLFTEETMKGFNDGFIGRGGKVIQEQLTPFTLEFGSYLAAVKQADVFVGTFFNPQFVPFITQYHEYGLEMPVIWGMTSCAVDPLLDEAGDLALGIISEGTCTTTIDSNKNKQFVTAFTEKYGQRPDTAALDIYSSLSLYLAAVEETGGDTTGEKVIETLMHTKLDLPAGYRGFDGSTYGIHDRYITQVAKVEGHNRWVVLETFRQHPRS